MLFICMYMMYTPILVDVACSVQACLNRHRTCLNLTVILSCLMSQLTVMVASEAKTAPTSLERNQAAGPTIVNWVELSQKGMTGCL